MNNLNKECRKTCASHKEVPLVILLFKSVDLEKFASLKLQTQICLKSFFMLSIIDELNTSTLSGMILGLTLSINLRTCLLPGHFFLFSDSVKMLSIRTTRQRSAWTSRWSGLRCWAFLSAYSCESNVFIIIHALKESW